MNEHGPCDEIIEKYEAALTAHGSDLAGIMALSVAGYADAAIVGAGPFDARHVAQSVTTLAKRARELEDKLKQASCALDAIANHAHNAYDHPSNGGGGNTTSDRQYGIGCADGHRCAAEVARAALARLAGAKV